MAYESMRDFLAVLEEQHKLYRVAKPVDRNWEPACLAKWMFQAFPAEERFGLWFERVIDSDIPIVTGALGASTQTYATALEISAEEINQKWMEALLNPVAPRLVSSALCQEVVHESREARLGRLPIPTWTPGKDAGPYLTTIVVTRNASSGVQNFAVYRTLVLDDYSVVVNLNPGRQGYLCCRSFTDRGQPAPIAWVVAAPPAVYLAAVANLPYQCDEINIAGGLMKKPVDLVKAKSIDLLVPANAEIIIEGEIRPGDFANEGPFGEFAGYMGPVSKKPVARIKAITHRKAPIYYGLTSQMPPSESTTIQSLTNAALLLKVLRCDLSEINVRDVYIDLTFGGLLGHCIVAMDPQYPGHGKRVGRLIADMTPLKRVTVVNSDVDIRDPQHVDWALNARFDAARDTVIMDDVYFPLDMDPAVRAADGTSAASSKLIMDATQKINAGTFSLPPRDMMMRALEVWHQAGLPEIRIPQRARLRVDHS